MNIFVVNTPFQLYVVRLIIQQYFSVEDTMIISTIKNANSGEKNVRNINFGIKGLLQARRIIKQIERNISDVSFIVPHIGNLFSSYFYTLSRKYGRPISVFYEGIALFYDPVVPNYKAKYKRLLQGLLLGIKYVHYEQL